MEFKEFNFEQALSEALSFMGFEKPTPIQEEAMPLIMEGKDLIACAQTGTGKTAAFLLPLLNKCAIGAFDPSAVNVLIVAPTRELALQIDQQIEAFGYFVGASSIPVYGGGDSSSWDQQKKALTTGADFVVATPGRLMSHMKLGYVDFKKVKHFVLDEADRMLDMGFLNDLLTIERQLSKDRQTLLFSATMPDKIRTLSKKILKDPQQINIAISKPAEGILQIAYSVYDEQKIPLLTKLLEGKENYPRILIFSSTKKNTKEIADALARKGFNTGFISSDLDQEEREQVLRDFLSKEVQILVATDVLSRGIDIKDINLVINYDVPHDGEDYVHRIGRTARAENTGIAITLIGPKDQRRFYSIEQLIEEEVRKVPVPQELGDGPDYNPGKRGSSHGRKKGYRGKSNRSGNRRNRKS